MQALQVIVEMPDAMVTLSTDVSSEGTCSVVTIHVHGCYSPIAVTGIAVRRPRVDIHEIQPVARLDLLAKFTYVAHVAPMALRIAIACKTAVFRGQLIIALLTDTHFR